MDMVKNKDGVLLANQDEIQKRRKEHFLEVLNRPAPEDAGEFDEDDGIADLKIAPTRTEIYAVLRDEERNSWGS